MEPIRCTDVALSNLADKLVQIQNSFFFFSPEMSRCDLERRMQRANELVVREVEAPERLLPELPRDRTCAPSELRK